MPISTPTLTVTDVEDGATATATIASGTAGATNTVSVVRWGGNPQFTSWTSGGSRSGNGNVTLTIPKGYYWAKCESVSGSESVTSNLVYFAITNDDDAVHQQIVDATLERLQGMTFTDARLPAGRLTADRIIHQASLDTANIGMPAIIVLVPRQGTQEDRGTNETDDIRYPVMIFVIEREARQSTEPLPRLLKWKEQIARAFRWSRLTGVTSGEVYKCQVSDDHVINPERWSSDPAYAHVDSALMLWFTSREPRGVGA